MHLLLYLHFMECEKCTHFGLKSNPDVHLKIELSSSEIKPSMLLLVSSIQNYHKSVCMLKGIKEQKNTPFIFSK